MNKVSGGLPMTQSKKDVLSPAQTGINVGVGLITNGGNLATGINEVTHY